MEAERWRRLSPLLDALLELEPEARARNLASLREEDPQVADDLEELLLLEEGSDDFLNEPVVAGMVGPQPGTVVGPYRLERLIGEGGMGQVWLAQRDDGLYQRRVALKLLRPGFADPNLRLRFTRERQILARLEHPYIARLLDAGISSDGQPYLALEYVEGEPITDWCRGNDIPVDERLRLFQQICRALSHAHANLIVHRDLKPSNILVTPLGEVRLLDFGIAKLLDTPDNAPEQTRTGSRAFTLHYAAPEQLRAEPVTTMTDVYTLGVVLYELLTDSRPYRLKRNSDAEWEEAILHGDPLRPSTSLQRTAESQDAPERSQALRKRARMLSGDLDNIVLKAMGKRPEQRYASVEAMAQDVERYREGKPVLAQPQSLRYRASKYVGRHRWALATAMLVVLVLSTALGIIGWQASLAVREANRAQAMQDFVVGLIEQAGGASAQGELDLPALLDTGTQRVDLELERQPETRAELYGVIAKLRIGIGDYREALNVLRRQRALIATLDAAPATLVLEAAALRGQVQRLQGESRVCIGDMQPHAGLAKREEGRSPLASADFYSELGRCQRSAGDAGTAGFQFQRAYGLRRNVDGAEAAAAESLADLANLQSDAGHASEALRGYRLALRELHATAGTRHPLSIDFERNICGLERHLGRLTEAIVHCRKAESLSLELNGEHHRSTINARRQLAALMVDVGRLREAERTYRASRRWLIARVGAHHAEVARDDNSLAITLWELGRTREALSLMDHGIGILRRSRTRNNLPDLLFNKALILHEAGDDGAALRLVDEARALRVGAYPDDHPLIGDTDRLRGEILAGLGRNIASRKALRDAAAATLAGHGPSHPRTHRAGLSLARFLTRDASTRTEGTDMLAGIARIPGADTEANKMRWRARAYLQESRCRDTAAADAPRLLKLLQSEVAKAMPEGGEVVRDVDAIAARCAASRG